MNSILLFHLNNLTCPNRTVQRSKWFLMAEKSLIRSDTSSSAIACNWLEEKNCLFSKRVLNNSKIKILTEVLNLDNKLNRYIFPIYLLFLSFLIQRISITTVFIKSFWCGKNCILKKIHKWTTQISLRQGFWEGFESGFKNEYMYRYININITKDNLIF